jgi:hypothetical protein
MTLYLNLPHPPSTVEGILKWAVNLHRTMDQFVQSVTFPDLLIGAFGPIAAGAVASIDIPHTNKRIIFPTIMGYTGTTKVIYSISKVTDTIVTVQAYNPSGSTEVNTEITVGYL